MNSNILISVANWITVSFPIIRLVLIIVMAFLGLLMVLIVLLQPSGENGMGAITGQSSDTFYSKNKSKSIQGVLKRLTVIIAVALMLVAILFFVTVVIYPVQ